MMILFRQIKHSNSQANKVSLVSVAMHSLFDAYCCLIHLGAGLYMDPLFNSFVMVSFIQFMIFSMFDLRLILMIVRARYPDEFTMGWERMRQTLAKIYSSFYG